jgi:hypothetical protein
VRETGRGKERWTDTDRYGLKVIEVGERLAERGRERERDKERVKK